MGQLRVAQCDGVCFCAQVAQYFAPVNGAQCGANLRPKLFARDCSFLVSGRFSPMLIGFFYCQGPVARKSKLFFHLCIVDLLFRWRAGLSQIRLAFFFFFFFLCV
jgi:hypothetical protein